MDIPESPKRPLNVVKLPVSNLQDITAGLRELADVIEANEKAGFKCERFVYVMVDDSGDADVGALGSHRDPFVVIGMLAVAQSKMVEFLDDAE